MEILSLNIVENSQQIIASLETQNQLLSEQLKASQQQTDLLQQLLKFHQDQEKAHNRDKIIKIIISAIPYIIIILIAFYIYSEITSYLETINKNVSSLTTDVTNIFDTIKNGFSNIQETISNSLSKLNPFS
jgi:cell shape-determining protein MreC